MTSQNFERIEMHVFETPAEFKVEILTCVIKIPKVSISMGGGVFNIMIKVTKLVKC